MTGISSLASPPSPPEARGQARISILEGATVEPTPPVAGASFVPGNRMKAVIQGTTGALRFDDTLLSKHVLFLGGIGTCKTNAMMQLVRALRASASPDDVFV